MVETSGEFTVEDAAEIIQKEMPGVEFLHDFTFFLSDLKRIAEKYGIPLELFLTAAGDIFDAEVDETM